MRRKAAFSGPDDLKYSTTLKNILMARFGYSTNEAGGARPKNVKPHGELMGKCVLCSQTTTSKNSKMPKRSVTRKGVPGQYQK
ncbi:hypothetical protein CEXT_493221 [Caerostris extrusa]|uniref:Uncharacterized protein n=1 Tax=Caerostris extrusa TaxID=172846 RepID=A0AAV4XQM9_CAEEX|nr:hypothetical protein CEXT_493221 [Caerostris extrusa]